MTDFEDVLNKLGPCGRYQMLMYCACFVTVAIAGSSMNLTIVFYAYTPDHWCRNPSIAHLNLTREALLNLTIPKEYKDGEETYSKCTKYDIDFSNWTRNDVERAFSQGDLLTGSQNVTACADGWEYDHSIVASSIVTEWDLVCGDSMLADLAKSIYPLGFMIGVVVFSFISDCYGRRPAFISSLIMKIGCTIGSAFSVNFTMFIILRFLLGCAALGNYVVAFVLVTEMIVAQTRTKLSPVPTYAWGSILMVIAGVAYLFREWRHLVLIVSVPQLVMIPVCFFIPESPRWLYVQNRHTEADAIVKKMAKMNGVSLPEELDVEVKKTASKGVFLDLIRNAKLRWFTIILCLGWMETSMVYYFLTLYSSDLGGDPYLNFLIGGGVELVAALTGQVIMHYIGRRTILGSNMVMLGISLFCMMFVPRNLSWINVVLSMIGRFCLELTYIAKLTYITEMLPTVVRNVGMSAGQSSSRIGGIIAPYIGALIAVNRYIPFTLLGVSCVLAGLLQYLLPETKDKKMLETIAEAEQVYTYRLPKSNCCSKSHERKRKVNEGEQHVLM